MNSHWETIVLAGGAVVPILNHHDQPSYRWLFRCANLADCGWTKALWLIENIYNFCFINMHFPFETTEIVLGRIVRSCIEKNMFSSGLSYRLILFFFCFCFPSCCHCIYMFSLFSPYFFDVYSLISLWTPHSMLRFFVLKENQNTHCNNTVTFVTRTSVNVRITLTPN